MADLLPPDRLRVLVQQFSARPVECRQALQHWADTEPSALARLGVALLSNAAEFGTGERFLANLLSKREAHLLSIVDTHLLSREQSERAATLFVRLDPQFWFRLTRAVGLDSSSESITRVLWLLTRFNTYAGVVRWLRRLSEHSDSHIRSKAALLLCQALGSAGLVRQHLTEETDPRVRANAVEALWVRYSAAHRPMLEHASRDPHHRVAANALVALWHVGDDTVPEKLAAMARHASVDFRAAAAWAMGIIAHAQFRPILEELLKDTDATVVRRAGLSLAKLPEQPYTPSPMSPVVSPNPEPLSEPQLETEVRQEWRAPQFILLD